MDDKIKKNLIILESITNLLIAIKIRDMYRDEPFDIIIPSHVKKLMELKREGFLNDCFDKVYCVDYYSINNYKKKLAVILDINEGIKNYFTYDISFDYSDIYFWNPSQFFFIMYTYFKQSKTDIRLHVYADAFGGYIVDSPDSTTDGRDLYWEKYPIFKKGIWDMLFKYRYRTPYVRDMNFDFYMMRPDLSIINRKHPVVEIPSIDIPNELEKINHIYNYNPQRPINQKWIVLTNVLGERREESIDKRMLVEIINDLPINDTIIKPHPRCRLGFFADFDVDIIEENYPLELYFLNNDVKDKVFISDESSAIFLSALVFRKTITVIWTRGILGGDKIYNEKIWHYYNERMIESGCKVYEPSTSEELKAVIASL